jgi:hypothetical protein
MDVHGFVWFTDLSWTEYGTEAGICVPKRGSSFLWVKRYIKEGSGKGQLSP